MVPDREPGQEIGDKRQATSDNELQTTDYGQNTQSALAVVMLVVQIVLTVALGVWLIPQLVGIASASLGGLQPPASSDLTSALGALDGQLTAISMAMFGLTHISSALSTGPLGAFSAAQWAMLLAGAGIVWFFGNRFLLAGSPERRGNHQEAA